MAYKENSDMQLLEISNQARKLTQMVSSWFKDADLVGGSKYINNVLLKDALQESLNMPVEFLDKREVERSRRVGIGDYSKRRFQEDEAFGSRSWRSCNEELKKVIRESLLLNCLDDDKVSSSRSLGSFITSGLNSSYHEEETKRKALIAPSGQAVRMKAPNLIARLMGLEEIPVGAAKPKCTNLNSARAKFDGQVSEETAPASIEPVTKPQRVTLRSIIEREKVEDLMERLGHNRDCGDEPGFSVTSTNDAKCQRLFVDEQASPFLGRGEEQGLNDCEYCIQESGRVAEVEHEEITMNHRLKTAHEPERKGGRSLKRTEVQLLEKSRLTSSSSMAKKTDVENAAAPLSQTKKATAATAEAQGRAASAKSSVSTKGGASRQSSIIYETTPATETKNTGMKPAKRMSTEKTAKKKDGEEISLSCCAMDASAINISRAADPPPQNRPCPKSAYTEQSKIEQKMIHEIIMPKANKGEVVDHEPGKTKGADKVHHLESLLRRVLSLDDARTEAGGNNKIDKDAKLYVSYAEELIARKRWHQELCGHPVLRTCWWRSSGVDSTQKVAPLHELVGEISKGFRALEKYSGTELGVASKDSLYERLEGDLKCKDMALNVMWDVAWRSGVCVEAADMIVREVEEHVASVLVGEVAVELMNHTNFVDDFVITCQ